MQVASIVALKLKYQLHHVNKSICLFFFGGSEDEITWAKFFGRLRLYFKNSVCILNLGKFTLSYFSLHLRENKTGNL